MLYPLCLSHVSIPLVPPLPTHPVSHVHHFSMVTGHNPFPLASPASWRGKRIEQQTEAPSQAVREVWTRNPWRPFYILSSTFSVKTQDSFRVTRATTSPKSVSWCQFSFVEDGVLSAGLHLPTALSLTVNNCPSPTSRGFYPMISSVKRFRSTMQICTRVSVGLCLCVPGLL